MQIAILSDIHSNIEALDAVLERAAGLGASTIVVLGDIVGYGASPQPVVERLVDEKAVCIAGNHDLATTKRFNLEWFNRAAALAVLWTQKQIDEQTLATLESLPPSRVEEGSLLVHGSPRDPSSEYLTDVITATASFDAFDQSICFFGHTHVPAVFERGKKKVRSTVVVGDDTLSIERGSRYLVNPGSVGQPRDGDPRASFAVFDGDTVRWHRVAYDIDSAAAKIRAAGLPERLADRLSEGR